MNAMMFFSSEEQTGPKPLGNTGKWHLRPRRENNRLLCDRYHVQTSPHKSPFTSVVNQSGEKSSVFLTEKLLKLFAAMRRLNQIMLWSATDGLQVPRWTLQLSTKKAWGSWTSAQGPWPHTTSSTQPRVSRRHWHGTSIVDLNKLTSTDGRQVGRVACVTNDYFQPLLVLMQMCLRC